MEIEGKIILDLPLQEGTSKAGNAWKKKEWVLETFGTYPRKVKFHIFGNKVDTLNFEIGKSYAISIDIESREFNGRWYTDVSAYAAREIGGETPATIPSSPAGLNDGTFAPAAPAAPVDPFAGSDGGDDLPF